ncbi:MAG: glycosyltransferase family 4 protein [Candidatus Hodarchaeota archaeon]
MRINILSDTELPFMKNVVGGINSAFRHHKEILRRLGFSYVINQFSCENEYDLIHAHTYGPLALTKRLSTRKPIVISAHNIPEEMQDAFIFPTFIIELAIKYLVWFYDSADHVVTPSQFTKNVLRQYGVKKPITVISNGVDIDKFKPDHKKRQNFREKWDIDDNTTVVYNAADIIPRKGPFDFLRVAKNLEHQRFFWVGRQNFGRLVSEGGSIKDFAYHAGEHITFPGFVQDIVAVHNGGDIFFFPSFVENQGISLLEAMACEKAPVVRDIPVFHGWLKDGYNCLKSINTKGFKENILLLATDETLRKKIGKNARKTAEENSFDIVGKNYLAVYKKLV